MVSTNTCRCAPARTTRQPARGREPARGAAARRQRRWQRALAAHPLTAQRRVLPSRAAVWRNRSSSTGLYGKPPIQAAAEGARGRVEGGRGRGQEREQPSDASRARSGGRVHHPAVHKRSCLCPCGHLSNDIVTSFCVHRSSLLTVIDNNHLFLRGWCSFLKTPVRKAQKNEDKFFYL